MHWDTIRVVWLTTGDVQVTASKDDWRKTVTIHLTEPGTPSALNRDAAEHQALNQLQQAYRERP